MIGIVIVSHSARLAEGVCELADQAGQGRVRLAAAGGTSDAANPIGTDAFRVLAAIESVYSDDGVVVLMDLGSALLNAETALEFLEEEKRGRVRLCHGPVVEGAVAAASLAAAGAGLDEILREAEAAAAVKALTTPAPAGPGDSEESVAKVGNRLGLHARPAAQLIRIARRFDARVTIENVTGGAGPFDASSLNGMLALDARQDHQLRIRAEGADASGALAELVRFIESGCGDQATPPREAVPDADGLEAGELSGIGASAGIAMGPLVQLRPIAVATADRTPGPPAAERQKLTGALAGARDETRALQAWAQAHTGTDEAAIFDAQLLFLEDPALIDATTRLIDHQHRTAEAAWQAATEEFRARLAILEDAYLRARAADVADVAARVMWRLTGAGAVRVTLDQPSILSAQDLTPSDVEKFDPKLVLGLCLETGSASAHAAILVRAMGIPAVVGLGPGISALPDGTTVAMDGERGRVWVSPVADQIGRLDKRRQAWLADRQTAQSERLKPASTRDGRRIHVLANLNRDAEVGQALDCGAEGVGVLRTEFLFLGRTTAPDEQEQFLAYRTIADALGARPLVIRTLDIGGDKGVAYVDFGAEANPFLGWRGIRVMLGRRDLFRTQLRAILRAGAGHPVEVLFPMISTPAELREAKAVLADVEAELEREGVAFKKDMRAGVMIEVPASVAMAGHLAREAGRLSIGTNDLTQYVMAADRTNARVAPIADPFQPAVLRMIRETVAAGREAGVRVDLCGEMAADPLATGLLIGLGLEEFSVSAPLIPELKRSIARWSVQEAEAVAREALTLDSSDAVRGFLGTTGGR